MAVSIRSLLTRWNGSLQLVVPAAGEAEPSIDEPLLWVHSSELSDPTPFLGAGQLLLTDGSQFPVGSADVDCYDAYVKRLSARGIIGLGFGTQLVHGELPGALEVACRRHGLPLFLITDLTPFLAIIRHVADVLADEQNERIRWSLNAQRAIARAAVRPDGLTSILAELERQLRCSVLLFDAVGAPIRSPSDAPQPDIDAAVRDAVRAALEKGGRSASGVTVGDRQFTVHTIGQGRRLDGALVLGELAWSDPAATDLVNSVIAMASLALTQNRALDRARRHLRAGLFEQLMTGDATLAIRTAKRVWDGLPTEPLAVMVAPLPHHSDFLLDALEREAEERRGQVFFTQRDERVIVLAEAAAREGVLALLGRHSTPVGTSEGVPLAALPRGVGEAERALRHALETGASAVAFEQFIKRGVLGLIRQEHAGAVARGVLRALEIHDAEKGSDLLATVRVWVQNDCAWDATARELGIHRHTLRNRVEAAGRLLGLDFGLLRDRLELWTAVQFMTED